MWEIQKSILFYLNQKILFEKIDFGIVEFRFHLVAEFRRPAMKKSKRFQKSSCFREQTPAPHTCFPIFPTSSQCGVCAPTHTSRTNTIATFFWLPAFGHITGLVMSVQQCPESSKPHKWHILSMTMAASNHRPMPPAAATPTWTQNTRSLHTYRQDTPDDQAMPTTNCQHHKHPTTSSTRQYNPAIDGAEVSRQNAPSQPHDYSVKLVEQLTEPHMTMLSHTTPVLASWRREPHQTQTLGLAVRFAGVQTLDLSNVPFLTGIGLFFETCLSILASATEP